MPPTDIPGCCHQWYGPRTFAQHGDDLVLACVFHSIGIELPSYLDIGAHHPYEISNTFLFYQRGSRGINVEANPNLIEAFYKIRPEDTNLNVGVAAERGTLPFYRISDTDACNSFIKSAAESWGRIDSVIEIPVVTIYDVIRDRGEFTDLLSIDIEQMDYEVLASIDYKSGSPKVICAECLIGTLEAAKIRKLLESNGYFFYVRSGGNGIFVRNEFKDRMF